jgi:hypothetical protein
VQAAVTDAVVRRISAATGSPVRGQAAARLEGDDLDAEGERGREARCGSPYLRQRVIRHRQADEQ